MCLPPGINHFFYNRKLLEIGRHLHGICHMLLHTYRKGTYPAQHQPGIKRAHDSAEQFPFALGDLIYILFAANHHTAEMCIRDSAIADRSKGNRITVKNVIINFVLNFIVIIPILPCISDVILSCQQDAALFGHCCCSSGKAHLVNIISY